MSASTSFDSEAPRHSKAQIAQLFPSQAALRSMTSPRLSSSPMQTIATQIGLQMSLARPVRSLPLWMALPAGFPTEKTRWTALYQTACARFYRKAHGPCASAFAALKRSPGAIRSLISGQLGLDPAVPTRSPHLTSPTQGDQVAGKGSAVRLTLSRWLIKSILRGDIGERFYHEDPLRC